MLVWPGGLTGWLAIHIPPSDLFITQPSLQSVTTWEGLVYEERLSELPVIESGERWQGWSFFLSQFFTQLTNAEYLVFVNLIMPPCCAISKVKNGGCKITSVGVKCNILLWAQVFLEGRNYKKKRVGKDRFGVQWGSCLSLTILKALVPLCLLSDE